MLNKHEIALLHHLVDKELRENADKFDTEAEIDTSLSYFEAKNNILEKIDNFKELNFLGKSTKKEIIEDIDKYNSVGDFMDWKGLFDKPKIIGLCANANEGKSNTLYYILEILKKDFKFNVFAYGLRIQVKEVTQIYSLTELEQIKDSLIIVDELFSLFDLDNRKAKAQIENTIRLIFHNNNILLLCGLGENFKKFLSAKLNAIIFKKTTLADLINGSSIKNVIMGYKGTERGSAILNLDIDEGVIFDGLHYHKLKIPYMKKYDTKLKNVPIFVKRIVSKKVQKKGDQK